MPKWNLKNFAEQGALDSLHSESDRGAAIIAATYLEDRLTDGIKEKLRHDAIANNVINELLRPSGPLGSFSTKIQLGFVMRIYGKQVFNEMKTINKIRNKFAHILGDDVVLSFNSESIKDMCANLKIIENYFKDPKESELAMFFKGKSVKEVVIASFLNPDRVFSLMGKRDSATAIREGGTCYTENRDAILLNPRLRYIDTCGLIADRFQRPDEERDPTLPADEFLILGDEPYPLP